MVNATFGYQFTPQCNERHPNVTFTIFPFIHSLVCTLLGYILLQIHFLPGGVQTFIKDLLQFVSSVSDH